LWFAVSVAMSVALVVHEFGHAAAVAKYGGTVRRVGVALMYLRPVCFCDVSSSWEFPRRRQRIVVSFAGIYTNLLIAGLTWCALWFPHVHGGLAAFARVFGAANVAMALLNLFPFIKLDGYWMLASALDRPNLRQDAIRDADAILRRVVFRRDATPRRGARSVVYGVGCAAAPIVLVALAFDRMWVLAGHLGPAGRVLWCALVLYGFAQLLTPVRRYARDVRLASPR
jgi:putative peptide zinc metalloprotease protein